MRLPWTVSGLVLAVGLWCGSGPRLDGASSTGPWKVETLLEAPQATWGERTGWLQEVTYEGAPLAGRPTRVFGYLGRPRSGAGERVPAMLLVHGGGGTAFREWAEHWAKRGYVALAMDLAGHGPQGRLPDGGPDQADAVKFREFRRDEVTDMWTYHAVAAILRGHGLLGTLPEVDGRRVGITGISWGGYLTCIVAGIDPGLKVAVPVYGCGYLGENSVWKDGALAGMSKGARARWLREFDPSRYLGRVSVPILFVNGTTDFAYPLDSYQKSYRLVEASLRHLTVVVDLPHGHYWNFPEVDAFVDSVLLGSVSLAKLGPTVWAGGEFSAEARAALPLKEAMLCYTADEGVWQKRTWKTAPARVEEGRVVAAMPPERPRVAYLMATDARGLRTSSEHLELPGPEGR